MKKIIGFVPNVAAKEMGKGTSGKKINKRGGMKMTVEELIGKLKKFNPSAEVRVAVDLRNRSSDHIAASTVDALDDSCAPIYIGFSQYLNKKKNKKSLKKVIIF